MDLKIDYAFKQLFGNEQNKDITVVFLNAILHQTGRNWIKDTLSLIRKWVASTMKIKSQG
ncbi:PD-(D/E)XK nuclease family transposase [Lentibacillus halodurans]|uniref:PD-(D/E)XK nuclease family transposase n=1 Tax=Lentibacillus halodurans TaxID=237679 RepID=UPI000A7DFF85